MALADFERASRESREAMREGRRLGLKTAEALGRLNLIMPLLWTGHAEEALAIASRSAEDCIGDASLEWSVRLDLGNVLLALGRVDEAMRELDLAIRNTQPTNRVHAESLAAMSVCLLSKNDARAAKDTADRAWQAEKEVIGRPLLAHRAALAYARACLALDEREDAERVLREGWLRLKQSASRIGDLDLRRSYLERMPWHAELVAIARELGVHQNE
jgi:tetratricopeptide (TPR) repeat protein